MGPIQYVVDLNIDNKNAKIQNVQVKENENRIIFSKKHLLFIHIVFRLRMFCIVLRNHALKSIS